jgi:hypothetical protein
MHVYKDAMESSAFLGFSHRVKHPKGGSTGFLLNYPDQNLLETLQVFFLTFGVPEHAGHSPVG